MKKLLIPIIGILLTGCIKKTADNIDKMHGVKWSGTYAVPVLNADLSMDDALTLAGDLTGVKPYSDGLLYLEYSKQHISKYAYELVPLNTQTKSFNHKLSPSEENDLIMNGTVTANRDLSFAYDAPGVELDSAVLTNGVIEVTFTQNYNHSGVATITFPGLTHNGVAEVINYNFSAGNYTNKVFVNMTGDKLNLSKGGPGFNQLEANLSIKYTKSGSGFSGMENISVDFLFTSQKYSTIYGYFGNTNIISAKDSLELGIFSNGLKKGSYNFTDPRFKIRVTNETGIPLQLQAHSLNGFKNGSSTAITGFSPNKNIAAATFANKSIKDSMQLDKNNSNFKTITDNQMHYVDYDLDVQANPAGKTQRNFLNSDSKVTLDVITELPFYGTAVNVVLEDTSAFNLGLGKEKDYIEWITFRLGVENNLPLDLGVQAYFMDSNNVVLDSLFQPFHYISRGANINSGGTITSPFTDNFDITLDKARIAKINNAKKMRLYAIMPTSTFNGSAVPVKITRYQHFKLKMGIHAKLSVNEKF